MYLWLIVRWSALIRHGSLLGIQGKAVIGCVCFGPQEEMAELKAQLYLLEKEKKALELKLSTREAQEQAYLVHIEHLKSEVEEQKEQRMRSLSSTSSSGKEKPGKVGTGWHGDTLSAGITPSSTLPIRCCLSFLAVYIGIRAHKKPNPP